MFLESRGIMDNTSNAEYEPQPDPSQLGARFHGRTRLQGPSQPLIPNEDFSL